MKANRQLLKMGVILGGLLIFLPVIGSVLTASQMVRVTHIVGYQGIDDLQILAYAIYTVVAGIIALPIGMIVFGASLVRLSKFAPAPPGLPQSVP